MICRSEDRADNQPDHPYRARITRIIVPCRLTPDNTETSHNVVWLLCEHDAVPRPKDNRTPERIPVAVRTSAQFLRWPHDLIAPTEPILQHL